MNYLQLVQRLKRKCRVTGALPATLQNGPAEEVSRLADWINEAWMDIQLMRPDWRWMRGSVSFTTTQAQPTYTLAQILVLDPTFTSFGNWKTETFRNYVTSAGVTSEIFMDYIPYDVWRDTYQFGGFRVSYSRPIHVSYDSVFSICMGPVPVSGYTVIGDYYKKAAEMSADTDTPTLGVQFHQAIIYRAMMFYGASEAAPEVYQEGELEFKRAMARISMHELTQTEIGGALA
jgi:hypothetical protein